MEKNSKIYVAGHTGLLGSALVRRLTALGYTNIITVTRQNLDLSIQSNVDQWFVTNKPEYVFLAAALVSGIGAQTSGDAILKNLQIQTNVIDAARRNNCKKLLFPGSNCAYPKYPSLPITEDQLLTGKLEPTSEAYAVAKIAGIKLCEHFRKQWGFDAISVMPCNLYGPNDNFDEDHAHVMAAMISKFVNARDTGKKDITLWGDGSALREFLYSDDAADALILCMNKYQGSDLINIASGKEISLKDLADLIKNVTGYTGDIVWDTNKPTGTPAKGLDTTKINNLGWKQCYTLDTGIPAAIDWYETSVHRNNKL
jgi:GDP-L-fucose synthase